MPDDITRLLAESQPFAGDLSLYCTICGAIQGAGDQHRPDCAWRIAREELGLSTAWPEPSEDGGWVVEANGVAWVDKLTGRRWSLVFDDVANLWTAANQATVRDALSSLVALVAGRSRGVEPRPADEPTEADPESFRPGQVIRHRDGDEYILVERKTGADAEPFPGWWLRKLEPPHRYGLADGNWKSGEWALVGGRSAAPARDEAAELLRLDAAATPAPWELDASVVSGEYHDPPEKWVHLSWAAYPSGTDPETEWALAGADDNDPDRARANAELVVALRNALPGLVALLSRSAAEPPTTIDGRDHPTDAQTVIAAYLANTGLVPVGDGWEQQCEDMAIDVLSELRAAGFVYDGVAAEPPEDGPARAARMIADVQAEHTRTWPSCVTGHGVAAEPNEGHGDGR